MLTSLAIHLWFTDQAADAAAFYASILPDSRVDRVTALPAGTPSGPTGSVAMVEFTLMGQRFKAINGGPHHPFNDAISLMAEVEDQAELDRIWDALCTGGTPGRCGWLKDPFGVSWQVVPRCLSQWLGGPDAACARRVTAAMLPMRKLDIAVLAGAAAS